VIGFLPTSRHPPLTPTASRGRTTTKNQ